LLFNLPRLLKKRQALKLQFWILVECRPCKAEAVGSNEAFIDAVLRKGFSAEGRKCFLFCRAKKDASLHFCNARSIFDGKESITPDKLIGRNKNP